MDMQLQDKHFLITGASGGIGLTITSLFLQEQAKVTAHYNTKLETLKKLLERYPDTLQCVQANLQVEQEVKTLFTKGNDQFGRIDGLIANAGIWPKEHTPIHEMSLERWNNTIATDLTGVFLCVKYFNKNLVRYPEEQGSIVLIGSTAGIFGEANHTDYATAKAGLVGLMMSVKNEIVHIAPKGRNNLVNPGWT